MKTLVLTLISLCLLAPAGANAYGTDDPGYLAATDSVQKSVEPEMEALDLTNDFLFQEKVYIHIEDADGKMKLSGAFSRQELSENTELRNLLRKSTRYLTLENHYYYFSAE